ncbi:MAG: DUF1598 domain-containing protein [Planctomycetota bacterium]|nr:DUF1598 domain-containing protein [Planctomycetota bacterium]
MQVRSHQPRITATRRGSTDATIIAVVACLALAAAGGFFYQKTSAQNAQAANAERFATANVDKAAATTAHRGAPLDFIEEFKASAGYSQPEIAADQQETANTVTSKMGYDLGDVDQEFALASVQTKPAGPVTSLKDQILAHIEFGEFTRAVELAKTATDTEERSQLLGIVADAQMKIGDFHAALGSIRSMPDYNERKIARDKHLDEQALAGGSQADFTQLIELIMSETEGMWEEVDGSGGTISQFDQGVRVEPSGVLRTQTAEEQSGRLKDLGIQVREALLNNEIAQVSGLRVLSLPRLEAAVARRLEQGHEPTISMKLLGGLTSIKHVFVYPEDQEIVIAGPAEGWKYNEDGLPVGVESGKPIMQLDDLVTVIRAFSATNQKFFSCSINPREEGLKNLKGFVEQSSSRPLRPGAGVRNWVGQLQQQLGRQDIVYSGINPESRVARTIVEADYRMKLIGIGKYDFAGSSTIPSIFDLMTQEEQKASKLDALRWWLTMKYDAVLHTPDRNGFEFVGSSVLCQSENQFLNAQGQQVQTGQSEGSNLVFAQTFTAKYEELAKQDIVFADLKNVFDLSLVAAILQHEGAARNVGWDLGVFSNEGWYIPTRHDAPREVDSVVNHRVFRGRDIVVQVAGGVRADLGSVIADASIYREGVRLDGTADQARTNDSLPANRWWWDAR